MNAARWKWALCGAVVLIVFGCFVPDLRNGLLDWDDAGYITDNVWIRSLSGSTVRWAFTEFHCNYWAPLTWLSLALDYAAWGLDPVGYHLTNDVLHALTAGLFFVVAHRLLQRSVTSAEGAVRPAAILVSAAFAAAFFGVHPLRVESVAWAAERKDVLSMAFGMGAVLAQLSRASVKGSSNPGRDPRLFLREPTYWAMLLLYALSLASKATLMTLPAVLLILDWFPLGRLRRGALAAVLLEKVPMLVLAVASSLVTMRAMAVSSRTLAEVGLSTRVLVALGAIWKYLLWTAFPAGLSPVFFHPGRVSLDAGYVIALTAAVCISAACLLTVRRWPALLAAWLIYLVALAPVLGILQNGPQEMAVRFTYFPSMALSLLAAAGGFVAWRSLSDRLQVRWLLPAGAVVLLAVLAILTIREIGVWRDDGTFWSRVIEVQPHRFGKAYFLRALFFQRVGRYDEALADANEALSIASEKRYPGIHENHALVGRILRDMGELDRAVDELGKASELADPASGGEYRHELAMLLEEKASSGRNAREQPRVIPAHGGR